MATDYKASTINDLTQLYRSGEATPSQVLEAYIKRIERDEARVGAFITTTFDEARETAHRLDKRLADAPESIDWDKETLFGVPVALKDNMCTQGVKTTCASKILGDFRPPYDGTAPGRLRAHGAVFVGKTNLDEFAMGSSCENSAFMRTTNPHNADYVPGGSSGGSAASVAADFAVAALGSDTGGSIRQPARFCGVVGMKPTYGLVSRYGLVAFASSLDQIGPFTRTAYDAALVLAAMCGQKDPRDSTSLEDPFGKTFNKRGFAALDQGFVKAMQAKTGQEIYKGARVGVFKELMGQGNDPQVDKAVSASIERMRELGATITEVSLPNAKYALAVYYILATAEASANLARFDGVRYGLRDPKAKDLLNMYLETRHEGFGPEVKRRIMLGTYALSSGYYDAYYKKAQQVRRLIASDFERVFAECDFLVSPTSPIPPFKFDEKTGDPLTMYLADVATIPANLAGIPGISLPCGTTDNDLPIGLQMLGPQLSDAHLLQYAHGLQQSAD